jgi:hypothetical protein
LITRKVWFVPGPEEEKSFVIGVNWNATAFCRENKRRRTVRNILILFILMSMNNCLKGFKKEA